MRLRPLGWLALVLGMSDSPARLHAQQTRLLPLTSRVNSRVRAAEWGPDSSWRYGMLNRFRSEPPCFVVMLFGPGMRVQREIPLRAVRRLQLSTYFDGSRGPAPWADTMTVAGEEWWEVPADTLRVAVATCHSGSERRSQVGQPPN